LECLVCEMGSVEVLYCFLLSCRFAWLRRISIKKPSLEQRVILEDSQDTVQGYSHDICPEYEVGARKIDVGKRG